METSIYSKFRENEHQSANNILQEHCNFSFIEMQGFIACVICEPEAIEHGKWLRMLGINDIKLSESNASKIIRKAMTDCAINCFNSIKEKLEHGEYNPIEELKKLVILDNDREIEKAASTWCRGFVRGVVSAGMLSAISDEKQAELFHPIVILSASIHGLRKEIKNCNLQQSVKETRQRAVQALPKTVNAIYQYWLSFDNVFTPKKITKTDTMDVTTYYKPCACGSGKLYNDCCLVAH